MPEAAVRAAAEALVGGAVATLAPARPGGNNRIFRVGTAAGAFYALKMYPHQAEDPRDRLGVEFAALSFLAGHGIAEVPRPLAADRDRHCALYEWIDGAPPPVDAAGIERLAAFLAAIQGPAGQPDAAALPAASAACFTAEAVVAQLGERRRRLDAAAATDPALASFLAEQFDPLADARIALAREGFRRQSLDFEAELSPAARVLSPSDFGFHNALAGSDGRLRFIDFEYFGWDDPVKAAADVALHAGMDLPPELGRLFLSAVATEFTARDRSFVPRLRLLYPVFALIWVLIILNEFLPERWARRVLAAGGGDPVAARARQLAKAARRLALLKDHHDPCPL